ncbi:MAG: hypothetical protein KDE57_11525 [Calditrichaeota bacterium]|nr:hypothetical protein [Calditrichota bacterium]MCB0266918.1 hypothetical protein [Calditrichota bacterium]MCB0287278.1 hypothetical protein [Calditrichota bacterium]MCB9066851.1 hypothetical protein [Calditrichia bacterium]
MIGWLRTTGKTSTGDPMVHRRYSTISGIRRTENASKFHVIICPFYNFTDNDT